MKLTKLPNGSKLYEDYFGNKEWYLNGKCHREDGPAVELANGGKEWWLNDKLHSQKEFERLMRLKAFW